MKKIEKAFRRCPRCHEKNFNTAVKCDYCGLVFSRLQYASNKKAKYYIINHQKENNVIYTNEFPADLNRWKTLILCALFGWIGAHSIYTGRYLRGIFSFVVVFISMLLILFFQNSNLFSQIYESFYFLPMAFVMIFWINDLILISVKKYKVPIALDLPEKESKIDAVKKNNTNKKGAK